MVAIGAANGHIGRTRVELSQAIVPSAARFRSRRIMDVVQGYAETEEQIVKLLGLPSAEARATLRRWTSSTLTQVSRDCLTSELAAGDGELGEALLAFCSALNADPTSPLAMAGYLYLLEVSDPGGRQLASELRDLSSNNPDLQRPRFWLGAALKRPAPQEAAKELEACVTRFPQDFQAWAVLAEVRSTLHDTEGARKAVLTALAGTSDPSRRS